MKTDMPPSTRRSTVPESDVRAAGGVGSGPMVVSVGKRFASAPNQLARRAAIAYHEPTQPQKSGREPSGRSGRLPGVGCSALLGSAPAKDEPEPRIPDGGEEKAAESDGKDEKPMNEESVAEKAGKIGEPRRVTQHAKGARKKPGAESEPAHRDDPDTDGSIVHCVVTERRAAW